MVNQLAIELVKRFEGFSNHTYKDEGGRPTIGFGTTAYPCGSPVSLNDLPISLEKGIRLLGNQLMLIDYYLVDVLKELGLILNNNQTAALLSLCYNCGYHNILGKTKLMYKALQSKDMQKIADTFLDFDHGYKKILGFKVRVVIEGLKKRREEERRIFLS